MKVLVTGGAGFIGSHLVDSLIANGHVVYVLDKLEKPTHLNGEPKYLNPKATYFFEDYANENILDRVLTQGIEVIFHLAATGGFTEHTSKYIQNNSLGTAKMMEFILSKKNSISKIFVASSMAIYGEGAYVNKHKERALVYSRSEEQLQQGHWENTYKGAKLDATPTKETDQINPASPYALSKYDQENIVINACKRTDIQATAMRFFLCFGPRQSLNNPYTGICSIFSTQILNDSPPILFEDGMQTRDVIYVGDLVKACLLLLKTDSLKYSTYNIGSGSAVTIKAFADTLIRIYGKKIKPVVSSQYRLGDVRHVSADISRIRELGFSPSTTLEEGLAHYAQWILQEESVSSSFEEAKRKLANKGLIKAIR